MPPRHAPVKLEESVEPVPKNPSLSVVPLPASPKKSDEDTGKPVSEAPLEGRSKDDDAETAASKTKIHLDPPEAARTVSPPLPLYNFKSPVHKPLKSGGQEPPQRIGGKAFGSRARERGCRQDRRKTGPSKNAKDRDKRPPHFSTAVPHQVRSSEGEPLYERRPQLVPDMLLRDAERLAKPDSVRNRVVYDSIEPNPIKAKVSPTGKSLPQPGTNDKPGVVELDPYYVLKDQGDSTLVFESRFESGNLRRAIQVYDNEYDLIIKPDINTRGHTQWFYFSREKHSQKTKYKFNMINLYKADSLYNRGMQPLIYSMLDAKEQNVGWVRRGKTCAITRTTSSGRGGYYYTATFTVEFPRQRHCVLGVLFPVHVLRPPAVPAGAGEGSETPEPVPAATVVPDPRWEQL